MESDKRKAPRRQLRYTAWISLPAKELHGCVIADISDRGARLGVEDSKAVPDNFILLLSASGKPKRKCRVVWREDGQIGVEFDKALARADKYRPIFKAEKMSPPLAMLEPEPDVQDAESTEPA